MPRFFFHQFNEVHRLDSDGRELPDAEAAVALAREHAACMIAERLQDQRKIEPSHHIDIEDDDGAAVATVRFADVIPSSDA